MEIAALVLEHAGVDDVVGERVPEGVGQVWIEAGGLEELRLFQLGQIAEHLIG